MGHEPHRQTSLPLLEDAKAYLRLLLDEKAPDTALTLAWGHFYNVYDDLIRRFAISRGIPHSEIDDCVQEVWSEVVTRLVEFDRAPDRPGLRAWLYAIVRGKVADVFRQKSRQGASQKALEQEPIEPGPDPAAQYEQAWEAAFLESVLEELRAKISEENYQIVRMRLIEDQSVETVADTLGLSREQARYRHHRAMRKLRGLRAFVRGAPLGDIQS